MRTMLPIQAAAVMCGAIVLLGVVALVAVHVSRSGRAQVELAASAATLGQSLAQGADPEDVVRSVMPPDVAVVVSLSERMVYDGDMAMTAETVLREAEMIVSTGEASGLVAALPRGATGSGYRLAATESQAPSQRLVVAVARPQESFVDLLSRSMPWAISVLAVVGLMTLLLARRVVGVPLDTIADITRRTDSVDPNSIAAIDVVTGDTDLTRLVATINDLLARIRASEDVRRAFLSDISHELRSPISAIRAQLDVVRLFPNSPRSSELMAAAGHETDRLAGLVEQMIFLARADSASGVQLKHSIVDLAALVQREVAGVAALRPEVTIGVEQAGPVFVAGDDDAIGRALRNLLDNAMRHTRTAISVGYVGVVERDGSAWAEIFVIDDGPGIDSADGEVIFDRFARVDDDRGRKTGGAGLGLAICRAIADAHGGSVNLEPSVEGAGACFRLRLPATTPREES